MAFNKKSFLLLLFILYTSFLQAEETREEWKLVKENKLEEINVYYQTLPGGNVVFKGVTSIDTSLHSLIALFDDAAAMPEWVYRTEQVDILKEIDHDEVYAYTVHSMPFPFKKRDAIIHSTVEQDPKTLSITIRGKGEPAYIPRKTEYVRITAVESFWKFTPLEDGSVEVIFQGYGEPGGNIPSSIYRSSIFRWLCEFFLWELPHSTLQKMKSVIKRNKYFQTKTFSSIKEPLYPQQDE